MKIVMCSMILLPSLLWAQTESNESENTATPYAAEETNKDALSHGTLIEDKAFFTPVEPSVPDSIAKRAKEANGLLQQRENREFDTVNNPFVLTPHKPNYFLPFSYTSNPNDRAFLGNNGSDSLQSVEFKFQLSMKFPVAYEVVGHDSSLWFAYTQQAYWQAYNSDISAPFRDTNHEPEVFLVTKPKQGLLGIKPSYVSYGFNHQSNGQLGDLSRSWNRVYMDFIFEKDNTAFSFKPWYRIHESSENDDNPNIENYFGYSEFGIIHIIDDYSFDIMFRNNLKGSGNKGAIQIGMNFPLWGKTRGYVQYFNGYGQSLLDYNHSTQSLSFGVMLTNWL